MRKALGRWVWPMPRLADGRAPDVSAGYEVRSSGKLHDAVDVMYHRPRKVTGAFPFPDHGSPGYEVPEGTDALAAADGKVWATGKDAHGHWVVLDHGRASGGFSTVYRHLTELAVSPHKAGKRADGAAAELVAAGQVLGEVGWDPTDKRQVRHLHFELRAGKTPVDPQAMMRSWEVL